MTLEEAKNKRDALGESFTKNGVEYKVTIAPKRDKDFTDFIHSYRGVPNKLNLAVACSIDQKFRVCGIWTDGINILKTNID